MAGFYGNIRNATSNSFKFDRIYSNKRLMDLKANTDGVFGGRYVLVEYDQPMTESFANVDDFIMTYYKVADKYYYAKPTVVGPFNIPEIETLLVSGYRIEPGTDAIALDDEMAVARDAVARANQNNEEVAIILIQEWEFSKDPTAYTSITELDNKTYYEVVPNAGRYYDLPYVLDNNNVPVLTKNTLMRRYIEQNFDPNDESIDINTISIDIDTEDPYTANYLIDTHYYGKGRGYDSTVWRKVFLEDGSAKYLNVAELNSVVPTFAVTADAPSDNAIVPHFSSDSTNVYYNLHLQTPWGFRIKKATDGKSDVKTQSTVRRVLHNGNVAQASGDNKEYVTIVSPFGMNYDGAIYYNKAGFSEDDKTISIHDNTTINNIMVDSVAGGSINDYNKQYDKETGELVPALDTKEISIMLPAIGNAVADMYDLMYGVEEVTEIIHEGQPNEETRTSYVRRPYINWDDANEISDQEKVKWHLVTDRDDEGKLGYEPTGIENLAGAINSVHDIMGMVITDKQMPGMYKKVDSPVAADFNEYYLADNTEHTFTKASEILDEFNANLEYYIKEDITKPGLAIDAHPDQIYYNADDGKYYFVDTTYGYNSVDWDNYEAASEGDPVLGLVKYPGNLFTNVINENIYVKDESEHATTRTNYYDLPSTLMWAGEMENYKIDPENGTPYFTYDEEEGKKTYTKHILREQRPDDLNDYYSIKTNEVELVQKCYLSGGGRIYGLKKVYNPNTDNYAISFQSINNINKYVEANLVESNFYVSRTFTSASAFNNYKAQQGHYIYILQNNSYVRIEQFIDSSTTYYVDNTNIQNYYKYNEEEEKYQQLVVYNDHWDSTETYYIAKTMQTAYFDGDYTSGEEFAEDLRINGYQTDKVYFHTSEGSPQETDSGYTIPSDYTELDIENIGFNNFNDDITYYIDNTSVNSFNNTNPENVEKFKEVVFSDLAKPSTSWLSITTTNLFIIDPKKVAFWEKNKYCYLIFDTKEHENAVIALGQANGETGINLNGPISNSDPTIIKDCIRKYIISSSNEGFVRSITYWKNNGLVKVGAGVSDDKTHDELEEGILYYALDTLHFKDSDERFVLADSKSYNFEEQYPAKSLYRSPENEFYVVDYADNPVSPSDQQIVRNQLNLYEPWNDELVRTNGVLDQTKINYYKNAGVIIGTRFNSFSYKELKGFARDINTLHGWIIKLNRLLQLGDESTRSNDTIQGVINQLKDIINLFKILKPGELYGVNRYGKVSSVDLNSNNENEESWILLEPSFNPDNGQMILNIVHDDIYDFNSNVSTHIPLSSNINKANELAEYIDALQDSLDTDNVTEDKAHDLFGFIPDDSSGNEIILHSPVIDNAGHVIGKKETRLMLADLLLKSNGANLIATLESPSGNVTVSGADTLRQALNKLITHINAGAENITLNQYNNYYSDMPYFVTLDKEKQNGKTYYIKQGNTFVEYTANPWPTSNRPVIYEKYTAGVSPNTVSDVDNDDNINEAIAKLQWQLNHIANRKLTDLSINALPSTYDPFGANAKITDTDTLGQGLWKLQQQISTQITNANGSGITNNFAAIIRTSGNVPTTMENVDDTEYNSHIRSGWIWIDTSKNYVYIKVKDGYKTSDFTDKIDQNYWELLNAWQ